LLVLLLIAELCAFGIEVVGAPVMPDSQHLGWVMGAVLYPIAVEVVPIAAVIAVGWLSSNWWQRGIALGLRASAVRAWDLVPSLTLFGVLVAVATGFIGTIGVDWSDATMRRVVSNSVELHGGETVSIGGLEIISTGAASDEPGEAMLALGETVVTTESLVVDVINQQVILGEGQSHLLDNSNGASVFATFEDARTPLFSVPSERDPKYARAIVLKRYSWPVAVVMLIILTGVWSLAGHRWSGAVAWLSYWGLVRISDHLSSTIGSGASAWGPIALLFVALVVSWYKRDRI